MKYFLVENREANYRNWYSAESIWDAQRVAMHDSELLAMDVTECDRESIPSDAVIYPASKKDVEYVNSRKDCVIDQILKELNATNLDEALEQIVKLKLGYQPWRDRRGELLSKLELTEEDKRELKEVEAKLKPLGWSTSFGRSHDDVQAMEIIKKAAKLIKEEEW